MLERTSPHRGVDFPQPAGTPIPVCADGTVALLEYSTQLGWVTVVKHSRTLVDRLKGRKAVFSGYAHQDAPGWRVSVGQPVKLGQAIGHVGAQGRNGSAARGTHLHWTMSHDVRGVFVGEVFDPVAFAARYPEPKPKPATVNTYTVRRGDTLDAIARGHHTTWQKLAQRNGLAHPDHIEPGDVIRL